MGQGGRRRRGERKREKAHSVDPVLLSDCPPTRNAVKLLIFSSILTASTWLSPSQPGPTAKLGLHILARNSSSTSEMIGIYLNSPSTCCDCVGKCRLRKYRGVIYVVRKCIRRNVCTNSVQAKSLTTQQRGVCQKSVVQLLLQGTKALGGKQV